MSEIIQLRPRNTVTAKAGKDQRARRAEPADEAMQRLIEPLRALIHTLEVSHQRIGAVIDGIPDPEAATRLGRDLAVLSAALRDAKAKVASLSLQPPDNES